MKTRSGNWYIVEYGSNKHQYDCYNTKHNIYKIDELLTQYQNEFIYRKYFRLRY